MVYLNEDIICESSDLVYVVICSTFKEEYIGETGQEKIRIQDRFRVFREHILQLQYQQLKWKELFRTCQTGEFKIFSFFEMHSYNKYLTAQYEKYFPDKL